MKFQLLILALMGTVFSSSSCVNDARCEFLAPLADFEIARGESLIQYPNGTCKIPMKGINSIERTSLYFTSDELFYYNTMGERKISMKKSRKKFQCTLRTCMCMLDLQKRSPNSQFIKDETVKICDQLACETWYHDYYVLNSPPPYECFGWKENGDFLSFEKLKKQMHVKKIAESEGEIHK